MTKDPSTVQGEMNDGSWEDEGEGTEAHDVEPVRPAAQEEETRPSQSHMWDRKSAHGEWKS